MAEKIRTQVEQANWEECKITISVGIATSVAGDTKRTIQSRADRALYVSKNAGRNRVTHASDL